MANTYVETTSRSWGDRLGGSFKGIFFGIVIFIVGTGLLWWNEGRTVRSGDTIAEVQMMAGELGDISKIDPAFNGKLVHATGTAKAVGNVTDSQFGITAQAIAIRRSVEYYQWVEKSSSKTEKKLGGGEETVTTYSYEKKWVSSPINSSRFKRPEGHDNTPERVFGVMPKRPDVSAETFYADAVSFGAYTLSSSQVGAIGGSRPLVINMDDKARMELQKDCGTTSVNGNVLYFGDSPGAPRVGDVRVSFTEIPDNQFISIIAQVNGNSFTTWKASNGESFSRLTTGDVSLAKMIQTAEEGNALMTSTLRVLGIFLVIIGLKTVLAPLTVLMDVVPLLGSIMGFGVGIVANLVGIAWSFIIIALAWIRFRPMLAACMLGVAALCVALVFLRKKGKDAPQAAPSAPGQNVANPSSSNICKGGALGGVVKALASKAGSTVNDVAKVAPGGIGGLAAAGALGALLGNNMSDNTAKNLALLGTGAVALNFYQKWAANKNAAAETGNATGAATRATATPTETPMQLDATSKLILRAMVYAARADGNIDASERERMTSVIGQMMPGQDVSAIIAQFEQETLDPATLAKDVASTEQGEDVYRLSCMVIDIDHFMERGYLDALGKILGLSPETMSRLEAEAQEAKQQLQQANKG